MFHQCLFCTKKLQILYMHINAPVGFLGAVNSSGWMTTDSFVDCLDHFKKAHKMFTRNLVLFILHSHASHNSLVTA